MESWDGDLETFRRVSGKDKAEMMEGIIVPNDNSLVLKKDLSHSSDDAMVSDVNKVSSLVSTEAIASRIISVRKSVSVKGKDVCNSDSVNDLEDLDEKDDETFVFNQLPVINESTEPVFNKVTACANSKLEYDEFYPHLNALTSTSMLAVTLYLLLSLFLSRFIHSIFALVIPVIFWHYLGNKLNLKELNEVYCLPLSFYLEKPLKNS